MEELSIQIFSKDLLYISYVNMASCYAVKAQYHVSVSRRPSYLQSGTISDSRHSKKGKLGVVSEYHCEAE